MVPACVVIVVLLLLFYSSNNICYYCKANKNSRVSGKLAPFGCVRNYDSGRTTESYDRRQQLYNNDNDIQSSLLSWRGGSSSTIPRPTTPQKTVTTKTSALKEMEYSSMILLAKAIRLRWMKDHDKEEEQVNDSKSLVQQQQQTPDIKQITNVLELLSSSQQAFKGLDGIAHEAYQRTSRNSKNKDHDDHEDDDDTKKMASVTGRAQRSATRAGAVADSLFACELCDYIEHIQAKPQQPYEDDFDSVVMNRQVILNLTNAIVIGGTTPTSSTTHSNNTTVYASILVLYEPNYNRYSGIDHGGIDDLLLSHSKEERQRENQNSKKQRSNGRILVIIYDSAGNHLSDTFHILDETPIQIQLYQPTTKKQQVTDEIVSIQPSLYYAAGKLLQLMEPQLRKYCCSNDENSNANITTTTSNNVAIHCIGRSLGGGIAAIISCILHGSIPLPPPSKLNSNKITKKRTPSKKKKQQPKQLSSSSSKNVPRKETATTTISTESDRNNTAAEQSTVHVPIQGLGYDRTSACILGSPPCLSSNVLVDYITAIVYGDDIICRTSHDSINRLMKRIRRNIVIYAKDDNKMYTFLNTIGKKQFNWITDTVSIATTNIQSHAMGSYNEEMKLSIYNSIKSYIIRPRRLHNVCSIHEIGSITSISKREALRASILWQLNDILVSPSLWKHHQLNTYIHGLDRVQLRGLDHSTTTTNNSHDEVHIMIDD